MLLYLPRPLEAPLFMCFRLNDSMLAIHSLVCRMYSFSNTWFKNVFLVAPHTLPLCEVDGAICFDFHESFAGLTIARMHYACATARPHLRSGIAENCRAQGVCGLGAVDAAMQCRPSALTWGRLVNVAVRTGCEPRSRCHSLSRRLRPNEDAITAPNTTAAKVWQL